MDKKEKEVWGIYPEYSFIEASDRGNYRTVDRVVFGKNGGKHLVKGHELKSHRTKGGYLQLTFGTNGKSVARYAHRVTAMTFIPNPDNLPEINHKNSNRTDNRIENLEWVTPQENMVHKEKYGKSAAEVSGRPLWAYNLETFEKQRFESQHEAGRSLGVDATSINMVIKGKLQQAGNYYLTEDEGEVTKEKIRSIKNNMLFLGGVIAINLATQDSLRFKSRAEAARSLKCNAGNIGSVIAGQRKQTKGFWFCHANKNSVESVRRKFGDEVANRVKELMKDTKIQLV